MPRNLLFATLCFCATLSMSGCASAQSGPQLATTFNTGVAAYDAGRYEEAFKIWWSIQDEDLAAMRNVAMMLRKGQGTTKDPRRAEAIYETAAEAGLPTAQADLADMLLKGEAGPPSPKRALPLLVAAAAANHPIAQYELAQMYETGQGGLVPRDTNVARRLYASAASHGMKEAADRLAALGGPLPAGAPGTTAAAAPGLEALYRALTDLPAAGVRQKPPYIGVGGRIRPAVSTPMGRARLESK